MLFDGVVIPPQPIVMKPATAKTAAARNRARIPNPFVKAVTIVLRGFGPWTAGPFLRLDARFSTRPGIEELESGDHEAIGLTGEGRREQRVTFRVAGELLRKRDQLLTLLRPRRHWIGHEYSMIPQNRVGSQPQLPS